MDTWQRCRQCSWFLRKGVANFPWPANQFGPSTCKRLDTCQDPEREELEGVNPCNQPEDMVFRLQNHGAGSLVLPPCECNCIFSCTGTHLACAHHFRNCGGHVGTNRPYRHMSCMFAQNGLRVLCISPTATLVRRSWSSRTFGASRSPCTSCCYHLFGYKAAISF